MPWLFYSWPGLFIAWLWTRTIKYICAKLYSLPAKSYMGLRNPILCEVRYTAMTLRISRRLLRNNTCSTFLCYNTCASLLCYNIWTSLLCYNTCTLILCYNTCTFILCYNIWTSLLCYKTCTFILCYNTCTFILW